MQTLKLADKLMMWVYSGKKKTTARLGRRDIKLGQLKLESVDGTFADIVVNVKMVSYTKLGDVSNDVIKNEGYGSRYEFNNAIREFYPHCEDNEELTLVEWR